MASLHDDDAKPPASTAHTRILIWRSEVATALASPACPLSSASTTSSAASATSSAITAASLPVPSQGHRLPRFWTLLVRRLSFRKHADDDGEVGPHGEVIRTAMYRTAPQQLDQLERAHEAEEMGLGEESSGDGAAAAAKGRKKAERLARAARLLRQQKPHVDAS
ncbi:hypothetical protein DCS_07355 [Drechmeria coniospora]|uniref:Uncharacterized protein n=1 Tax=Drechmeria coniospora TaxID=98403 RepID=A0A151GE98_DRECN|nr:hypothetical protein DCS_07355 [Drechmeria coniospora]KYK55392.1 hypothetical protein DCS_07355 [Drechmeria coniospora]ODA82003.1 hypothetical protein RJ55_00508 [Drechmeria coniospora]